MILTFLRNFKHGFPILKSTEHSVSSHPISLILSQFLNIDTYLHGNKNNTTKFPVNYQQLPTRISKTMLKYSKYYTD